MVDDCFEGFVELENGDDGNCGAEQSDDSDPDVRKVHFVRCGAVRSSCFGNLSDNEENKHHDWELECTKGRSLSLV